MKYRIVERKRKILTALNRQNLTFPFRHTVLLWPDSRHIFSGWVWQIGGGFGKQQLGQMSLALSKHSKEHVIWLHANVKTPSSLTIWPEQLVQKKVMISVGLVGLSNKLGYLLSLAHITEWNNFLRFSRVLYRVVKKNWEGTLNPKSTKKLQNNRKLYFIMLHSLSR